MKNKNRFKIIKHLLIMQLGLIFLIALVFLWAKDLHAAYSAVLGGMVCMIPNILFASLVFQYQGARSARKIVSGFYKGEALKIILSIVLFAIVFIMCNITPFAFFITYIVVQFSYWFAPWVITNK